MNQHASANAISASWSDPDAAIEFLAMLRPRGPWNLAAIKPDGPIQSATFTDPDAARAWVAARSGRENLYYVPNAAAVSTGKAGRALKTDIVAVQVLHADLDIYKLPDDHELASLPLDERKQRVIGQLKQAWSEPPPPSFIIDSGGGLQVVYRLSRPLDPKVPDELALAERANRWLANNLIGADAGTWSISHLLRLPGTVNLPDGNKQALGRVPAPARLVEGNGRGHDIAEFALAEPRVEVSPDAIVFDAPAFTEDLAALAEGYTIPERLVTIIRMGRLPERKPGDDSRSAWLFDAVCGLVRCKVPDEIILGLILDPLLPVSESVLEKQGEAEQLRYAERQVRNAHAALRRDVVADYGDPVDPQWLEPEPTAEQDSARAGGVEGATASQPAPTKGTAASGPAGRRVIRFTPYVRRDPKTIPTRDFLMKPVYIRKFTTGTLAHGAVGKSRLLTADAVALASGRSLVGYKPRGRFRVALWNGEDPEEELVRSVEAVCKYYDIPPEETDGYLLVDSGRNLPINVAVQERTGTMIAEPEVDALIQALREQQVDVLLIDPFVSSHSVNENDNSAIEKVAQAWNLVADRANVAVHMAHHAVKAQGREVGAMDYRGGGAALAKLRYLRVLNRIDNKLAEEAGIEPNQRRLYVRIDDGEKSNLLPPGEDTMWFKLESVDLENADYKRDDLTAESDKVGVVIPWTLPDLTLKPTREQIQAAFAKMEGEVWRMSANSKGGWVGIPIAKALALNVNDAVNIKMLKDLIDSWAEKGVLVHGVPAHSDAHGNKRKGYVAGVIPADLGY